MNRSAVRRSTTLALLAIVLTTLAADGGSPPGPSATQRLGRFAAYWTRPTELRAVTYDPGSNSILTEGSGITTSGLSAIDATTGVTRWRNPVRASWVLADGSPALATSGVALARSTDGKLYGVELASGRMRWQTELPSGASLSVRDGLLVTALEHTVITWHGTDTTPVWQWLAPEGCTPQLPGSGIADIIAVACPDQVTFLDVRTGAVGGAVPLAESCPVHDTMVSALIVGLVQACSDHTVLTVLDLSRRGLRWQRRIGLDDPDGSRPELRIAADLSVVTQDGSLTLVGADGEDLRTDEVPGTDEPIFCTATCLTVRGGLAHLAYRRSTGLFLAAVDPATGREQWSRRPGGEDPHLIGDHWYVTGDVFSGLSSGFLTTVALRGGRQSPIATLLLGAEIVAGTDSRTFLSYATNDGGLYQNHLAAVTLPGPVAGFLGGAAPTHWPDACALLTPDRLRRILPTERYTAVPEQITAGVSSARPTALQPRTVECPRAPGQHLGGLVRPDAGGPHPLLTSQDTWRVDGVGDLCLQFLDPPPDGVRYTRFAVVTGDLIIGMEIVGEDQQQAVELARALAEGMAATRTPGRPR